MFFVRKITASSTVPCVYRTFAKFVKKDADPGISRRKKLLPKLENEEIADVEDLESDFMEVHKLHQQHEKELAYLKEREKYLIVREKYFKEKSPNFLTWHDKEQIRYLHNKDPEEWTIERLSEGFPAHPTTIKKLVKSSWTKMTQHKIANHDASVQNNWKLFKQGKMPDLPKHLVEHLNKFTNRSLNLKPFVVPGPQKNVVEVNDKTTSTEFVDIIKNYAKRNSSIYEMENTNLTASDSDESLKKHKEDVIQSTRRRSVTLTELQDKLTKQLEIGKNMNEEERYIISNVKSAEKETIKEASLPELRQNKYQTSTGVQQLQKKEKDNSHLNYPDKIIIPKNILKKGSTYKLNDCYYDDDGEFLYRVPGMG